MTDIDTAAIRAVELSGEFGAEPDTTILALCDALDATRAELKRVCEQSLAVLLDEQLEKSKILVDLDAARAERDSANLANGRLHGQNAVLHARAEAAEAREVANWREVEAMRTRVAEVEADITIVDDLASVDRGRIAAALDIVNAPWNGYRDDDAVRADLRRALIERTGQ